MLYPGDSDRPQGVPSVIRAYIKNNDPKTDFVFFTKRWQEFAFSLIVSWSKLLRPHWSDNERDFRCKKFFEALYRSDAFATNKAGVDICNNYISGGIGKKSDPKLYPIFCGGNVVRVVGPAANVYGKLRVPVRLLNARAGCPSVGRTNWNSSPQLIQWATIETRVWNGDNSREIRPFDYSSTYHGDRDNLSGAPYFHLCDGDDISWSEADRIVRISAHEALDNNPYK